MADEEKGFAARWSKRKVAARQDEQQEPADQTQFPLEPDQQEKFTDIDDVENELLTEEDFDDVDFDALDKSSDYTRFAKSNVPAAVQKKALRKLWDSDSVFEVLDGMNDYDEDFTGDGLAGKVLKTAYQVGRGYMSDEEEVEPESKTTSSEEQTETQEISNAKTDDDSDTHTDVLLVDEIKQESSLAEVKPDETIADNLIKKTL